MTFTTVYKEYKDALYSYVYFRVDRNHAVTEDIVSDIFVKAYRNFASYDQRYAMSTWLYTIARNTLIDYYRKGTIVLDIDQVQLEDETDPLYRLVTESISWDEVKRAVADLPETQRRCIQGQFWDGKTAKEVATELSISHAAARQHVSRGIAALRQVLLSVALLLSTLVTWYV